MTETRCACGTPKSPYMDKCAPCWYAMANAQTPEQAQTIGRAILAPYLRDLRGPSLDDRMSAVDRQYADDREYDRQQRNQ